MPEPRDPADLFRAFTESWQALLAGADAGRPTAPDWAGAVDRFLATQSALAGAAAAGLKAWADLVPQAEAGDDLSEVVDRFREQLLRNLDAAPDALRALGNAADLWPSYFDRLQRLDLLGWSTLRDALSRERPPSAAWTWPDLPTAPKQPPGVGPGGDLGDKVNRAFAAWVDSLRALQAYQAVVADLWTRAFERFAEAVAERARSGIGAPGARELTTLYLEVAEAAFVEGYLTPEYIEAQSKAAAAAAEYRARERDLVDVFLKAGHVPGRTELDETNRRVHELRREVRALRRELEELRRERAPEPDVEADEAAT